jgi:hypothetical protein
MASESKSQVESAAPVPPEGAVASPLGTGGYVLPGANGHASTAPSAIRVRLRELIRDHGITLLENLIRDEHAKDADRLRAVETAFKYSMPTAVSVTDMDGNTQNLPPINIIIEGTEIPSGELEEMGDEAPPPPPVLTAEDRAAFARKKGGHLANTPTEGGDPDGF